MSAALKLKEDEVPYGDSKIIPISQKAREYLLVERQNAPQRLVASKPARERHDPKLITWLYRRYVEPYYPSVIRASRAFFVHHTVPFLANVMCPEAVAALSSTFYGTNARTFRDCSKAEHMRQTMIVVGRHEYVLPHNRLKTARQKEALRIIGNLTKDRPDFYLSCRELQARMLLPTPTTAHRLLVRLCQAGHLERLTTGQNRADAFQKGVKAMAATFRLSSKEIPEILN